MPFKGTAYRSGHSVEQESPRESSEPTSLIDAASTTSSASGADEVHPIAAVATNVMTNGRRMTSRRSTATRRSPLDLRVADEIVACVAARVGIDPRRIHSVGHSAGALHTTQMSFHRSAWLASVVTFSGGLGATAPTDQELANKLAALIFTATRAMSSAASTSRRRARTIAPL